MSWLKRVRALLRTDRLEDEMDKELRFHLDQQIEDNVKAGMSPQEARFAALRKFGGVAQIKEECRAMSGTRLLEGFWQDLRYGLRMLRRSPGLTLVAVISLALGIGPNVAVFSLLNEALLKGPTAKDPGRLFLVQTGQGRQMSYPNYRDLEKSHIVEGLAGYTLSQESWTRGGETRTVYSHIVTGNFFEVLGVQAAAGRTFTAMEAEPGRNPELAVLSHHFWQSRLAGDRGVIGSNLIINNRPFTVLGVLPEGYRSVLEFGETPELYLPVSRLSIQGLEARGQGLFVTIGRLPGNLSLRQAEAALTVACARLEQEHPEENRDLGRVRTIPLSGWAGLARYDAGVWTLGGLLVVVVGLVLLVACANVAGLLLARASGRQREIAMRLALGAGRLRLVRQLLTESLLLAAAASSAGLLLNMWVTGLFARLPISRAGGISVAPLPDVSLLLYGAAIATAATLLCGLAPALQGTRVDLIPALKDESARTGYRRFSLRSYLVAGQVAISTVLLITGALFLRSLLAIAGATPGFDVDHTIVARINLAKGKSPGAADTLFFEQAMSRVEEIRGVRSASCAGIVPLSFSTSGGRFWVDGREDEQGVPAYLNVVGRRYFETLGISLLRGREFQTSDGAGAPPVAIVNETFARRIFHGSGLDSSPIGARLVYGEGGDRRSLEIVGIVGDSKYFSLGEAPEPQVFLSYLQPHSVRRVRSLLVRADNPGAALTPLKRALLELDPSAELEIQTMRDHLSRAFWPSRIGAYVLGGLGVVGLLLAMVGVYGIVSYAVTRRRPEIGIRIALGASRPAVLRLILWEGLRLVGSGVAAGAVISALATKPLAAFLASGVGPTDPASFIGVLVVLLSVGMAAVFIPAYRATKVDPMVALRYE